MLTVGILFRSIALFSQTEVPAAVTMNGSIFQSLPFYSKTAGGNIRYSVYLPPDYYSRTDSFPVFYLLHGLGGNENSWLSDFALSRIADSLITCKAMPSMIIVMPDGRKSYFINDYNHAFPYETIFIDEFIPHIDSLYKTKSSKPFRAIGGLSMGGYGALIHCMRHPGHFSASVSLSAAVRTDSMIMNEKSEKYKQVFRPVFGDSIRLYRAATWHWIENSPLYQVGLNPEPLRSIRWYLDCGFSDYLIQGNEALHDLFTRHGIPHEYHVRPGNHNKAYWETALIPALLFTGRVFEER